MKKTRKIPCLFLSNRKARGERKENPLKAWRSLRPSRFIALNPPILPSATLSLHQPKADKFAAQGRGIRVIARQDFIDLLFTVTLSKLKRLDNVTQDRFQFLALRGERFQTPITP